MIPVCPAHAAGGYVRELTQPALLEPAVPAILPAVAAIISAVFPSVATPADTMSGDRGRGDDGGGATDRTQHSAPPDSSCSEHRQTPCLMSADSARSS